MEPPGDELAAVEFALRFRAPFISKILSQHPVGSVLVELEPPDATSLLLADGRPLLEWISDAAGESLEHFRRLVDAEEPPLGPLIATVNASEPGTMVLYDGWHRGAAWFERCRVSRPSTIEAYLLILTRH